MSRAAIVMRKSMVGLAWSAFTAGAILGFVAGSSCSVKSTGLSLGRGAGGGADRGQQRQRRGTEPRGAPGFLDGSVAAEKETGDRPIDRDGSSRRGRVADPDDPDAGPGDGARPSRVRLFRWRPRAQM
jgi:hypothetical protein